MKQVVIIGGGLAGLVTANCLAQAGISVTVFEKKEYPFHRVCGEYISNETVPFLKSMGVYPQEFHPPSITRLQLTSVNGRVAELPLDLGGFGISRYSFDLFLYQKAKQRGVNFWLNTEVESTAFADEKFEIKTREKKFTSDLVIGAFGKRSKLDKLLKRDFIQKHSPYLGVKYHIRTEHPIDLIALHNFKDGYCGISNIEEGKSNLCYLTHRSNLKQHKDIEVMEQEVLYKNPFLKSIFKNADFLFERPEVINEISFETKSPIENHILMTGDAAGMITPLCGNGMALAIHSAKILSELVIRFDKEEILRNELETSYSTLWNSHFAKRLWAGRQIQKLFGSEWTSNVAVNLARHAKPFANFLVKQTHGEVF